MHIIRTSDKLRTASFDFQDKARGKNDHAVYSIDHASIVFHLKL